MSLKKKKNKKNQQRGRASILISSQRVQKEEEEEDECCELRSMCLSDEGRQWHAFIQKTSETIDKKNEESQQTIKWFHSSASGKNYIHISEM